MCVFRWVACSVLVVHLTIFTQRAKKNPQKNHGTPAVYLLIIQLSLSRLHCLEQWNFPVRTEVQIMLHVEHTPGWQQIDVTRKVRVVLCYVGRQYDRFWTVSPQWDAILRVLNLPYLFQICIVCAVCECGIKYGDDLCNPVSYKVSYMQVVSKVLQSYALL